MISANILIVDDDKAVRFALEEMVERDGHNVVAVESGEEALARSDVETFDLALIDLKLKGMDGLEVLRELRQRSPDMVLIVLTAHASLETAVEALRHGAHNYLFKPCKTVDLRESIRAGLIERQDRVQRREVLRQLERSLASNLENIRSTGISLSDITPAENNQVREPHGRFLQRGGLIVDSTRHVITLDGELLELSPTEFDLLAYLVSEHPRVVSAEELVREVQGYESKPWEASNIVRSHIYRIRQKIEEATGRTDIVVTVRGVGYTIGD
jgi:DNA-binding response OmpR family regulator